MKKPEIPLAGNDGIPLRDEIELEKILRINAIMRMNVRKEEKT
jgi:hypothetical protein